MNFDLTTPCRDCPFRTDIVPFLTGERVKSIYESLERQIFPCHNTLDFAAEEATWTNKTQHCAGALIMKKHMGEQGDMAQIAERLGLLDMSALDMNAPVFKNPEDWIKANR